MAGGAGLSHGPARPAVRVAGPRGSPRGLLDDCRLFGRDVATRPASVGGVYRGGLARQADGGPARAPAWPVVSLDLPSAVQAILAVHRRWCRPGVGGMVADTDGLR